MLYVCELSLLFCDASPRDLFVAFCAGLPMLMLVFVGQVSDLEMRELLSLESDLSVEEILLYRGVAR